MFAKNFQNSGHTGASAKFAPRQTTNGSRAGTHFKGFVVTIKRQRKGTTRATRPMAWS
jgi:hypothetical protein